MTIECVRQLLDVPDLPGTEADLKNLVRWTDSLARQHGEAWIREFRHLLLGQWDYILSL